jgi:hypothetical protein
MVIILFSYRKASQPLRPPFSGGRPKTVAAWSFFVGVSADRHTPAGSKVEYEH